MSADGVDRPTGQDIAHAFGVPCRLIGLEVDDDHAATDAAIIQIEDEEFPDV